MRWSARTLVATAATLATFALIPQFAHAELPPGYVLLPGNVPLNPAHVGAVGSQFQQTCSGLPRPLNPGEVAWHFILPQSVLELFGPQPVDAFNSLTLTFASAGTVNMVTGFGPPSAAHAYVFTPTDDTLTSGSATIGRRIAADPTAPNDSQFNLSHTCAAPAAPATTTATTISPTTTTTEPTTTTVAAATTTVAGATTTTAVAIDPTARTSSPGGGGVSPDSALPSTGRSLWTFTLTGLLLVGVGVTAVVVSRRSAR
jgi:hypothetical protein